MTLRAGEAKKIKAIAGYSDETSVDATPIVRFVSAAPSVVMVTAGGTVHAVRPGKALVTGTFEGQLAEVSMVVRPRDVQTPGSKKQLKDALGEGTGTVSALSATALEVIIRGRGR